MSKYFLPRELSARDFGVGALPPKLLHERKAESARMHRVRVRVETQQMTAHTRHKERSRPRETAVIVGPMI